MNELALFAGAGGGILGGHLLGWRTVCAVEWEPYAASVLLARQNDGILPPFPIWDDVQTFDGKPWAGRIDVVSGGFPCQDISAAGRGAGIKGTRSGMWGHMARIIGEVEPRYVYVENSPMLTSRGLGTVLGDLASLGFDARWGVVSAADVGAPHKRDRIWIVANAKFMGWEKGTEERGTYCSQKSTDNFGNCGSAANVAHFNRSGRVKDSGNSELRSSWAKQSPENPRGSDTFQADKKRKVPNPNGSQLERRRVSCGVYAEHSKSQRGSTWWDADPADASESDVGRVAHGVAARVDRLKAIGNGQVPLVAATAWRLLNDPS